MTERIRFNEPSVRSIAMPTLATIPEVALDGDEVEDSLDAIEDHLEDRRRTWFGRETFSYRKVWRGYVGQPAAGLTDASDEGIFHFRGGATVAIIDTGIDPGHELFEGRLVPGYDFIADEAGHASEWHELEQSAEKAILDQSTMAILGDEEVMQLNQSTMAILGEDQADDLDDLDDLMLGEGFGHGTMVAGIIHRIAPEAYLMPIRAFDGSGEGDLAHIIEAIYWAVDHGADVLNMSFTYAGESSELEAAIEYALANGVYCVAAAGNEGETGLKFPAAYDEVIGVASTSLFDELSEFSNFGDPLVTLAAPGEAVITTFPGGGWAVAAGTSFAAPWVSGAMARLVERVGWHLYPDVASLVDYQDALSAAAPVSGSAGYGRLDLGDAFSEFRVVASGGGGVD